MNWASINVQMQLILFSQKHLNSILKVIIVNFIASNNHICCKYHLHVYTFQSLLRFSDVIYIVYRPISRGGGGGGGGGCLRGSYYS